MRMNSISSSSKDGRVRLRVQLLAEDGSESIEHEAMLSTRDEGQAAELARSLLDRAPASIRRLFDPAA